MTMGTIQQRCLVYGSVFAAAACGVSLIAALVMRQRWAARRRITVHIECSSRAQFESVAAELSRMDLTPTTVDFVFEPSVRPTPPPSPSKGQLDDDAGDAFGGGGGDPDAMDLASFCTRAMLPGDFARIFCDGIHLCTIPLPDVRIYRTLPLHAERHLRYLAALRRRGGRPLALPVDAGQQLHAAVAASLLRHPSDGVASAAALRLQIPLAAHQLSMTVPRCDVELLLFDLVLSGEDYIADSCAAVEVARAVTKPVRDPSVGGGGNPRAVPADALRSLLAAIGWELPSVHSPASARAEFEMRLKEERLAIANSLLRLRGMDEVFAVAGPLLLFPFCSLRACQLVREVFAAAVSRFGELDFANFRAMMAVLFGRDRPEVLRDASRVFRTINASRSGTISLKELCTWLARHLSKTSPLHPDLRLAMTLMSLRLPFVLFLDCVDVWLNAETVFESSLTPPVAEEDD